MYLWQTVQSNLLSWIGKLFEKIEIIQISIIFSMPYLQATMDEVLRMSSILPNGVSRQALSNVTVQGMDIPKGTLVQINMYYIHHNPKVWGDPENFRPERHLSEDGKMYKRNENLLPFSVGRRQCLGETLARDTIFLFMANIVQKFSVECIPGKAAPTLEPAVGISLNPQEYSVIFKDRNEE